jgi:hypothetical protein
MRVAVKFYPIGVRVRCAPLMCPPVKVIDGVEKQERVQQSPAAPPGDPVGGSQQREGGASRRQPGQAAWASVE